MQASLVRDVVIRPIILDHETRAVPNAVYYCKEQTNHCHGTIKRCGKDSGKLESSSKLEEFLYKQYITYLLS